MDGQEWMDLLGSSLSLKMWEDFIMVGTGTVFGFILIPNGNRIGKNISQTS